MGKIFKVNNGAEIKIKPVNLLLADDIADSFPAPEPPIVEVERPDGTTAQMEDTNENSPAYRQYQKALLEREKKIKTLFMEAVLVDGCDFELDEGQLAQVQKYRERQERRGIKLNPDDKYVYIVYIQIGDFNEVERLSETILNLNQATKEELKKAQERFRS